VGRGGRGEGGSGHRRCERLTAAPTTKRGINAPRYSLLAKPAALYGPLPRATRNAPRRLADPEPPPLAPSVPLPHDPPRGPYSRNEFLSAYLARASELR